MRRGLLSGSTGSDTVADKRVGAGKAEEKGRIRRKGKGKGRASGGRAGTDKGRRADKDRSVRAATAARHEPAPPRSPVVRTLAVLVALGGTVLFAVVLARLTLTPSYVSEELIYSNLRPGETIRRYLYQPAFLDTLKQLGGNVAMGVPFGVLLPVAWPRARGLLRVGVLTMLVMSLVELVQGAVVPGRAFDIDDVILNTTGALVGYLLLGRRLGRAVHPRRRHWWHRWTMRERPEAPRAEKT